jgi:dienelactone hydrolase
VSTDTAWPDFLANCGVLATDIAQAAPHHRSFLAGSNAADPEAWRAATRARFLDLLHYQPPATDPAPELLGQVDHGDFVQESLTIATSPWTRVPLELLIPARPRGGRWPAPGIVGLHCHGGLFRWGREKLVAPADPATDHPALVRYRQELYGGQAFGNELARRGYVVAVIDAFYFGERRLLYPHGQWPEPFQAAEAALEPDSEEWLELLMQAHKDIQPRVAGAVYQAGATWPGIFLSDDRRTIDFLQSRAEVDGDRIGCVGLSVGGTRSGFLAAADERVKAAVAVGWLSGIGDWLPVGDWPHSMGWVHYVPGMFTEFDLPDVATLACPRSLLIYQGLRDTLFPTEASARALERVRQGFKLAGHPERFVGKMFDVPHTFNPAMQDEAFRWLDESL